VRAPAKRSGARSVPRSRRERAVRRARPGRLSDYTESESGLQFKDVKKGSGASPAVGDRLVYDWEGYTIGHELPPRTLGLLRRGPRALMGFGCRYYGRIFQAKNGVKGGAFDKDIDYQRFVAGPRPHRPPNSLPASSPRSRNDLPCASPGSGTVVKGLEEGLLGMQVPPPPAPNDIWRP
jgi:hypothetical protein